MSRIGLIASALLACALALPSAASAERWVTYGVTVEAEGVYAHDRVTSDGERHIRANWTWRSEFPELTFKDDQVLIPSTDAEPATTAALVSAESTRTTASDTYRCEPVSLAWTDAGGYLEDPGIPVPDPQVGMRLLGGVGPDFGWCPHEAATSFDLGGALVDGWHTYDTVFSVPKETIGMGRIIQLVREEVTGRRCPDNADAAGSCRLTIDATITLDKLRDVVVGDGPPPDIDEDDIPLPPEPIAPDAVVVGPAGTGLPASARRAAVNVSCPAACEGSVVATLPKGRRASAARARALARTRFTAEAGQARRVVVRFSRSARRRIRRAGGVVLKVRTTVAGRTDTQRVRLRLGSTPTTGGKGPRPRSSGRG